MLFLPNILPCTPVSFSRKYEAIAVTYQDRRSPFLSNPLIFSIPSRDHSHMFAYLQYLNLTA